MIIKPRHKVEFVSICVGELIIEGRVSKGELWLHGSLSENNDILSENVTIYLGWSRDSAKAFFSGKTTPLWGM